MVTTPLFIDHHRRVFIDFVVCSLQTFQDKKRIALYASLYNKHSKDLTVTRPTN